MQWAASKLDYERIADGILAVREADLELAKGWLDVIQQWMTYVSYCAGQPLQAPACKPFWTWVMIALLSCGALTILVIAWKFVSYRLKLAAALRAGEERARVDHDAIAARRWDGDKAYRTELGGEEIEKRIREAVEERRAAHPPFPDLTPPDRR